MSEPDGKIRINVHLPWWFRRATLENRFQSGQYFFETLIRFLMNEPNIILTVSARAQRAQDFPQETYCLNYHKSFTRRRNLNVKGAYFHTYFYCDGKGYSGWSEIADSIFDPDSLDSDEASRYFDEKLSSPYLLTGISKYVQPTVTPDLPDNFVFFPMQVPDDKVLDLSYVSQSEILQELTQNPRIAVVIKPHPLAVRDHQRLVEDVRALHNPQGSVFVVDGHLHEIIRRSRAVICTNSGAGVEALLLGKPVITCGKSDYHHLTTVVKNRSEIWPAIASAKGANDDLMKKYALWLFGQKLIDIRDDPIKWTRDVLNRLLATK